MDDMPDLVSHIVASKFELEHAGFTNEQVATYITGRIAELSINGLKVVPIIGGPASGKSTLTNLLIKELTEHGLKADSISADDYNIGTREWRWQNEREAPLMLKDFELLNKHINDIKNLKNDTDMIAVPTYDQLTGLAIAVGQENYTHKIGKLDVLFVDGDFDPVEAPDLHIFINVPAETRMQTRINRDLKVRGQVDAKKVANSFKSRHEKQYIPYTAPAIHRADIVLSVQPKPDNWMYDIYRVKQYTS